MSKVDVHKEICKDLNELYARKNADYGDSFGKSFEEYGLTMACIRLEDKLNRIKALSKQVAQVSDESIEDTLMDLANYSIMTLVELNRSEKSKAQHKVEQCRYYGRESKTGIGRCLGTPDLDRCVGGDCERWKPNKEDDDA